MKKFKFLAVLFSVLMILSMVITAVSAETEPTETIIDTEAYTEIETEPTFSSDYTEPTEGTEYTEAPTEPTTEFIRPTEYPEDYQPSTHSNYVSPQPVYTPAEQDFNEVEWEKIELDISNNSAGVGDFSNIKNNTSKGDSNNYTLLIVGIILIALAIAGITFVILYNPKMLAGKATASRQASAGAQSANRAEKHRGTSSNDRRGRSAQSRRSAGSDRSRSQSLEQKRRNYDDYNDGY